MSLQLPFGVAPVNPVPVDAHSGPYTGVDLSAAVASANSSIASGVRFQSMEVRIVVSGVSYKYWYNSGTTNADLTPFSVNDNTSYISAVSIDSIYPCRSFTPNQDPKMVTQHNLLV